MQPRIIRILRRGDGRFVTVGDMPGDGPLGVDANLNQAVGTAVREATALSRQERRRVLVAVQGENGSFKVEQIVNPPCVVRKNPRPAKPRT